MEAELTLHGGLWIDALKQIRTVARAGRAVASDLLLEFAGGDLKLACSGMSVSLSGAGAGAGRAIISCKVLDPLILDAKSYAKGQIRLWKVGDRLHIGSLSLSCRWTSAKSTLIGLSLNSTLTDVLRLRFSHSPEAITASGLDRRLVEAESRKAELITRAAQILEPLGISCQMLNQFVTAQIWEAKD